VAAGGQNPVTPTHHGGERAPSGKSGPYPPSSPSTNSAGASGGAVAGRSRWRNICAVTRGSERNASTTIGVEHCGQLSASTNSTRINNCAHGTRRRRRPGAAVPDGGVPAGEISSVDTPAADSSPSGASIPGCVTPAPFGGAAGNRERSFERPARTPWYRACLLKDLARPKLTPFSRCYAPCLSGMGSSVGLGRRSWEHQAVGTAVCVMGCEPVVVPGRPNDPPECASSANG